MQPQIEPHATSGDRIDEAGSRRDRGSQPAETVRRPGARWTVPLSGCLIVLATLAAYANSFQGVMLRDDQMSIVDNPTIRKFWPIWKAFCPPHDGLTVSGRPLLNLTFAANYALGGLNPWGYHAVNLAIHILAALTLFGILRRTFAILGVDSLGGGNGTADGATDAELAVRKSKVAVPNSELRILNSATPHTAHPIPHTLLASAIALLWALHPLQTESVTYIVQRAESLCGLFYLLTLYCVIRGATLEENWGLGIRDWRKPRSQTANPQSPIPSRFFWYLAAVLACLLGMATKEVMVTAPLVVLLYDRAFLCGSFVQALRQRKWLYGSLAATWLVLGGLVISAGLLPRRAERGTLSVFAYAHAQPAVVAHYLRLSYWPSPLCFEYFRWEAPLATPAFLGGLAILGCLATAAAWGLARRTAWGFLAACFLLTLAPSSSIVPLYDVAAEHRMYLPLVVPLLALVLAVYLAGTWLRRQVVFLRWAWPPLAAGMMLLACLSLGHLTARRNVDYRSGLSIWQDTADKIPRNERAHFNLGNFLRQQDKVDEAIAHYQWALRLRPDYADPHNNLANTLCQQGRLGEAAFHFQRFLELSPPCAEVHYNLANVYSQQGRLGEAIDQYRKALEIRPDLAEVQNNFGRALAQQGALAEAIEHFRKALEIRPDFTAAQSNLGSALGQQGKLAEAVLCYAKALQACPDFADARRNLRLVLFQQGKEAQTAQQWNEVMRRQDDTVAILNKTAWILATNPDPAVRGGAEAVELATRAAKLGGDGNPAVLDTLAAAYAEAGRFGPALQTAREARALALRQHNTQLAEHIAERIKLYLGGQPYHDQP
jgi:tetratricopeptide (TPR) repeat protein